MSYEIFYTRAFIRVGERFIPMVNEGGSNTWLPQSKGPDLPEKSWQILNYKNRGKLLYTEAEIRDIAKDYEAISQKTRSCYKSRNRRFELGEFERWILRGMKTAYTIEEYTEMGNTLYLVDSTEDVPVQYFIDTTDKLLEHLRALGSQRILKTVFLDSRKVYRPTCPWQKRQLIDYRTLEVYYVLRYRNGYFCKWLKRGFLYTAYGDSASSRKFKTEKEAQRYLDKYKERLGCTELSIERMARNGLSEAEILPT